MLLQKRIHEWTTALPLWQRDLLRRLTAGPLDEDGEHEILAMLAGSPAASAPVPLQLSDLPSDEGEYGEVELRAVRDLRNINCLAPEQTLCLQPGLNVVFGDNGSGKSGYGRLIRRVTRSGEPEEVLRDVFDPGSAAAPQTACFDIAVDGVEQTITVDLASDPARTLSAIGAFDAGRARLFVSKPNVIEHTPRPLRLLRSLSLAQDRLAELVREEIDVRESALPALPDLQVPSTASDALLRVNAGTDVSALVTTMQLSQTERAKLDELESAAAAIRADQGKQLEQLARTKAANARSAMHAISQADAQMPATAVSDLAELSKRLADVNDAEQRLAERAFADQPFAATGGGAWRELWYAAERFAGESDTDFPPGEQDQNPACPLCQQGLNDHARERISRFQEFVSSDLRHQATDLLDLIAQRMSATPDVKRLSAVVQAHLSDAPEQALAAAGAAIALIEQRTATIAKIIANERYQFDPVEIDLKLIEAYADEQDALAARHAGMRDEQRQQEVIKELGELRARDELVNARGILVARVDALKEIAGLRQLVTMLATQKITMKLRELQEATITERMRKAIDQEIAELQPVASRIEVSGKASKGATVIELRLKAPCRAKVGNVLSDGEQRALSLAFFLAELAVSEERSAIVFDDPVSSLDHDRRVYLAGRLAEESKRRQVIVFSHDLAFLQLLREAADEADMPLHGQTLQRAFNDVGVISGELPLNLRGTSKQITALEHRLRSRLGPLHKRQDPAYERAANTWVLDLRKAYDQLIEDTVLASTVRRFSSHVQVRKLHQVKWTKQIAERIDAAMRKASPRPTTSRWRFIRRLRAPSSSPRWSTSSDRSTKR
ncbi:MAG TPA: AAA family ATPase [Solirubrobacteraceae bacterium]|nr:AAA family ATPase [Solirubrobacteraceae bacterium]